MPNFEHIQNDVIDKNSASIMASICKAFYRNKSRSFEGVASHILRFFSPHSTEPYSARTKPFPLSELEDQNVPLVGHEYVSVNPGTYNTHFAWDVALWANYRLAVDQSADILSSRIGILQIHQLFDDESKFWFNMATEDKIDQLIDTEAFALYCQSLLLRDMYPGQKLKKIDWNTAELLAHNSHT